LIGLALINKAAITSAIVTRITAICGSYCLVFDQRPLGAALDVGLSFIEDRMTG
jgi:hypothetical protein